MATRFLDLGDYPREAVAPPVLRLVESAPEPRPMPPSWMIAPVFREALSSNPNEPRAFYRVSPAASESAPYRSIREVPRAG